MTARKTALIALILVVVLTPLLLLAFRPGPQGQAEALFTRIAYHLEQGSAGDLIDEVDQGYDFVAQFPILDTVHEFAQSESAQAGADADAVFRESLRRSANRWFEPQKLNGARPVVTWRIHEVGDLADDGTFTAQVSWSVTGLRPAPVLSNHRFLLSTHGWLRPVALIRGHDPISL